MVYRVFVEKKKELAHEARNLLEDLRSLLHIEALEELRIINRYDVENISEELFDYAVKTVLSEPQLDLVSYELDSGDCTVFAVEYLPGQFDQRADSAAQCIQIISQAQRPEVRTARVYILKGELSESEIKEIKKYVINPVEAREAAMEKPETLLINYDIPSTVETLEGFTRLSRTELEAFIRSYGLAPDRWQRRYLKRAQKRGSIDRAEEKKQIKKNLRKLNKVIRFARTTKFMESEGTRQDVLAVLNDVKRDWKDSLSDEYLQQYDD